MATLSAFFGVTGIVLSQNLFLFVSLILPLDLMLGSQNVLLSAFPRYNLNDGTIFVELYHKINLNKLY